MVPGPRVALTNLKDPHSLKHLNVATMSRIATLGHRLGPLHLSSRRGIHNRHLTLDVLAHSIRNKGTHLKKDSQRHRTAQHTKGLGPVKRLHIIPYMPVQDFTAYNTQGHYTVHTIHAYSQRRTTIRRRNVPERGKCSNAVTIRLYLNTRVTLDSTTRVLTDAVIVRILGRRHLPHFTLRHRNLTIRRIRPLMKRFSVNNKAHKQKHIINGTLAHLNNSQRRSDVTLINTHVLQLNSRLQDIHLHRLRHSLL